MAFPPRESQPEKQKVASPMFTRIESFLVENRFAGASCAHERIHHRDATPCKQVSPFALVVNVLEPLTRMCMLQSTERIGSLPSHFGFVDGVRSSVGA